MNPPDCEHEWRVNPHARVVSNPPRYLLACAKCGYTKVGQPIDPNELEPQAIPANEDEIKAFWPGMRESYPDLCWRVLPDNQICIRDRFHDDSVHE